MTDVLGSGGALWLWLLLACVAAYATKLAGYLMPARWLRSPTFWCATKLLRRWTSPSRDRS